MAEHRAEADRVSRAELDARVEKVREIEVGAARVSEAARYQERLAHEKAEMEKLHRFQLSKLREKEIQMTDRLMQQQRKIDAMEFDHRGQVERESAEMQTRRAEHEAWVAEARAAAAAREAALEEREQKHLHDHRLRTLDLEKQLSRAAEEVAEARDYRERVRAEVLAEAARGLPPQYAATLAAAGSVSLPRSSPWWTARPPHVTATPEARARSGRAGRPQPGRPPPPGRAEGAQLRGGCRRPRAQPW